MQTTTGWSYHANIGDAGPLSGVIQAIDSDQIALPHNINDSESLPRAAILKSTPGFQYRHPALFSDADIGQELMP